VGEWVKGREKTQETPLAAAQALIGRKQAVQEVSNKSGHNYALRIVPFTLRVQRDYFVKGTNNFKIAKRKTLLGKWDDAGLLWEKETTNPKMKIAGRACYNMAIISEIDGNVDIALQWAQKSYEDYFSQVTLAIYRIAHKVIAN
jgi:hypothetical protein